MIFTSFTFLYFFLVVLVLYWVSNNRTYQNGLLLIVSYVFYCWVHPWFGILIAVSTCIDYFCGLKMQKESEGKKKYLYLSLLGNLGLLGFFKYFNFFADSFNNVLSTVGLDLDPIMLNIFLPVGISFYTFQSLSYTIDIYRGELEARKNFIDFAAFVSFFPQLVAGPIERAKNLLPQLEKKRKLSWQIFDEAIPLIIRGYFKKLVIADAIALYANQVFIYEDPPFWLLLAGTMAFALQIYADFSAYTDIARGVAKLLGIELIKNFNLPYLALSPSDFWRRWHISFSTFIRDYLYISLGGSKVENSIRFARVIIITMTLSGLWHGAAWNFVFWGLFHGLVLFIYRQLGMAGRWRPQGLFKAVPAWIIMTAITLFGWFIFRSPNISWLSSTLCNISFESSNAIMGVYYEVLAYVVVFSLILALFTLLEKKLNNIRTLHYLVSGVAIACIVLFFVDGKQDFIYFQF